jgi:transcriptional regulator with PAS, ATPase and Fis domain
MRDLESRNGTFVNGQKCNEWPLSIGDVVRCGEWVGIVVVGSGAGPTVFRSLSDGLLAGPNLWRMVETAFMAAARELPISLVGETGTGKEVIARAIHDRSGRIGPFLAVNCAAIPATMAEAEFFGVTKGAFTGADQSRPGLFRAADGGTLLLDEITDLPLAVQAKLLRVLEQGEVLPVGSARAVPIRTRIIAAGQQPLARAVEAGRFRPDLLGRLKGLEVTLPPLRQRREEVCSLFVHHFRQSAGQLPKFQPRFMELLCLYDWPLNVREVVQLARRLAVQIEHEPVLKAGHLPPEIQLAGQARGEPGSTGGPPRGELELLREAIDRSGGNLTRAASSIGVSRMRAYRLLKAAGVDIDSLRDKQSS